jgi:hypothetical protein
MISKPDKTGVYEKYGAEMNHKQNITKNELARIVQLSFWDFHIYVVLAKETVIKAIENMKKGVKL